MKRKILVVDDEPDTVELIEFNLRNAGFETVSAIDGPEAIRKARSTGPELIVLDLMLPLIDGLEVCKLLRRDPLTKGIPIIMLTAKAAEMDRVLGLELGANDYITKPFSPRELILRIKNVLEQPHERDATREQLKVGAIAIDIPRHRVTVREEPVELTSIEFKLITLLAQRVGRVQSREQLLQDVWHYENLIDTRTVDTHVRRLREKLGKAAKHLDTVRGVGYRLIEE